MKTDMMYEVLYGYSGLAAEGVQLNGVKEVADFILTHGGGMITEEDGTPLLEIWDGKIEYATLNGTTDIGDYINDLQEKTGIDFSYSFSGTAYHSGQKVQLGDMIECRLTYDVSILGFGETVFPITVTASAHGISQVYWK